MAGGLHGRARSDARTNGRTHRRNSADKYGRSANGNGRADQRIAHSDADGRLATILGCDEISYTVSGCNGWRVTVWDIAAGEPIAHYRDGVSGAARLAFGGLTPDLLAIVIGSEIRLWQIDENRIVETILVWGIANLDD